jgi:hypothetical protein
MLTFVSTRKYPDQHAHKALDEGLTGICCYVCSGNNANMESQSASMAGAEQNGLSFQ